MLLLDRDFIKSPFLAQTAVNKSDKRVTRSDPLLNILNRVLVILFQMILKV